MNKRGQESIPVLQAFSVVKMIIGVVVVLIIIGIVVTACSFIQTFSLDSGTEKTFDSLVKNINLMSKEDYAGSNIIQISNGFVGADLAIVGFDIGKSNVLDVVGVDEIVNRPFECGDSSKESCLVICAFGDDVEADSCIGDKIVGGKVAVFEGINLVVRRNNDELKDVIIRGEGLAGANKGLQPLVLEKSDNTIYIDILEA